MSIMNKTHKTDPNRSVFARTQTHVPNNTRTTTKMAARGGRVFGSLLLKESQIFFETQHSFASVNIRPVVPGIYI